MGTRVLVAMSGGVDSSVAAWLLLRQGYECVGVTMQLFHPDGAEASHASGAGPSGHSGAGDPVADARDVARRLGIPHEVCDLRESFERHVIRPFAESYQRGDTPNPCVQCNRFLKFGALLQKADEWHADFIATGHYARVCLTPSTGRWAVRKGLDPARDQSYVLACLTQRQLSRTLFPLGRLHKSEVRRIAEAQGFLNAQRRDSQDICFIPDGDYAAFLERRRGQAFPEGEIRDREGRVLGRHKGAVRYTLGQRKGLGVSAPEPLYVCGKSMADNTVTLGPESALYSTSLIAKDWVWEALAEAKEPIRCMAKARYRHTERPATAETLPDGTLKIVFDAPQRAITSGQSVVLYRGDTVLGGGTIVLSLPQ